MARKKNKPNSITQDLHAEILMHARTLHFSELDAYKDWCQANGFHASLQKSLSQRKREVDTFRRKAADFQLKKHNKEGKLCFQIGQLYEKKIRHDHIHSDALLQISTGFKNCAFPKLLYEVLLYLEAKTKFIEDVHYVKGIIALVDHRAKWIRPLEDWQLKTRNTGRLFSSLVRHLVAKYPVPEFMDNAWLNGNAKQQNWYIHIGTGKNIRTARSLPIVLTKKMAHHFMQAPRDYGLQSAFRWAQIKALGGNSAIANAVNQTRLSGNFRDDPFWLSVFRFFIDHPMLDTAHINPIVDFIWHQKYENRIEFVARGVAREAGPAQPNFSMHGRTPETLLRQVEKWHRQLGRESRGGDLHWRKSIINDYESVEGNARNSNMKIWTIRELLNSKELIAEGRTQHHCVATYARSGFDGKSSIWTMDVKDINGGRKMVTIEVNSKSRTICQIRGKRNRLPTPMEMNIVRRWAQKEALTIATYCGVGLIA